MLTISFNKLPAPPGTLLSSSLTGGLSTHPNLKRRRMFPLVPVSRDRSGHAPPPLWHHVLQGSLQMCRADERIAGSPSAAAQPRSTPAHSCPPWSWQWASLPGGRWTICLAWSCWASWCWWCGRSILKPFYSNASPGPDASSAWPETSWHGSSVFFHAGVPFPSGISFPAGSPFSP